MSIKVKFFASLRETLDCSEASVDFNALEQPATVAKVWASATQQDLPANLFCAINQEHSNLQAQVKDGDEVAFFPPITGG